jgi:predicted ATP-grasp superfamily ATP-dependent carboligase
VSGRRPEALLAMGDYPPTLCAARALGRAGVPVALAEWRRLVPARWSRHVGRVLRCPELTARPEDFLAWLLALGERQPGMVLLAPSDDLAWLYARHREALSRHFVVAGPGVEAVDALLDKVRLEAACRAVGIEVPASWTPAGPEALQGVAGEVRFPLLVKPRSQVFLWPHQKGRVVRRPEELEPLYRAFAAEARHAPMVVAHDPGMASPFLQAFVDGAADRVYSLAGFVDRSGQRSVLLGTRKVVQRPRLLGIGLLFEEAEVLPELAERLLALFRRVGFHGVFEVEYVEAGGAFQLIDANPRFYGEMAFDVARGAPLPWLAWLDAVGDEPALEAAVAAARAAVARPRGLAYRHWIQLEIHLLLQRLAGRLPPGERRRLRGWLRERRGRMVDAALDRQDPLPGLVDLVTSTWHPLRHARSTWRQARHG